MTLVTYLPRALPLQLKTEHWPDWLKTYIEYLPVAVIAALVVPGLFTHEGQFDWGRVELWAAVPTLIIAYWKRNLLLAVLVGTGTYLILQWW